jgi:hypothetical protein
MRYPIGFDPQRRATLLVLAALISLLTSTAAWSAASAPLDPSAPSAPPPLSVLWDQELLSLGSVAMDIRWASDRTVYVAFLNGVRELALDGKFTRVRELLPSPRAHGPFGFETLAVSAEHVAASSLFRTMALRSSSTTSDGRVLVSWPPVGIVESLDISAGRLLLLGNPGRRLSTEGGIAWLGPVTDAPAKDLRPILLDSGGERSPGLVACSDLQLGFVRFLGDGSFVVVPGSQPGVHLFNSDGHRIRTWDSAALGLDTDAGCSAVDASQHERLGLSPSARAAFLNQHTALEAILPLPQGPGLVIRSVAGGTVQWVLKVLRPDGTVSSYRVPFTSDRPYERLRGDARGDRIVFLLGPHDSGADKPRPHSTHVYVVALPPLTPLQRTQEGGRR